MCLNKAVGTSLNLKREMNLNLTWIFQYAKKRTSFFNENYTIWHTIKYRRYLDSCKMNIWTFDIWKTNFEVWFDALLRNSNVLLFDTSTVQLSKLNYNTSHILDTNWLNYRMFPVSSAGWHDLCLRDEIIIEVNTTNTLFLV